MRENFLWTLIRNRKRVVVLKLFIYCKKLRFFETCNLLRKMIQIFHTLSRWASDHWSSCRGLIENFFSFSQELEIPCFLCLRAIRCLIRLFYFSLFWVSSHERKDLMMPSCIEPWQIDWLSSFFVKRHPLWVLLNLLSLLVWGKIRTEPFGKPQFRTHHALASVVANWMKHLRGLL